MSPTIYLLCSSSSPFREPQASSTEVRRLRTQSNIYAGSPRAMFLSKKSFRFPLLFSALVLLIARPGNNVDAEIYTVNPDGDNGAYTLSQVRGFFYKYFSISKLIPTREIILESIRRRIGATNLRINNAACVRVRACVYNMISPTQLYNTRSIQTTNNPIGCRGNTITMKQPQTNDTYYTGEVCYSIYLFVEVTYRALTIPHTILGKCPWYYRLWSNMTADKTSTMWKMLVLCWHNNHRVAHLFAKKKVDRTFS